MATNNVERPAKRAKLLEDSDSDCGDGGALSINKEYAKRYEYNQKRKEKEKLEAKYGKGEIEDSETDSESETEDDEGELATEELDAQITATLRAIRSKDPRVYDANYKFFTEDEDVEEKPAQDNGSAKEKPMTLKDYHTKNLLEGRLDDDAEDDAPIKTYAQEQEDARRELIKQMHDAAGSESEENENNNDDDDDDDGFLVRKHKKEPQAVAKEARPTITELDVKRADKDPDTYLSNFLAARAWVPGGDSRFQPLESDDEEEEARAEAFEAAYNLRFEDPSMSNEKLRTHARDVAAKQSVRRDDKSGRRKARDAERTKKEEEKAERQREKAQLRKLKIEEMEEKVNRIRRTAGLSGRDFKMEEWADVLDADFNSEQWDAEMRKRFGDSYYGADEALDDSEPENETSTKSKTKKPKKPKWDDDIDIKDLIPDFKDDETTKPLFELSDEDAAPEADASAGASDSDAPKPKGLKKKERLAARAEAKKNARRDRRLIENLVDQNLEIDFALPASGSASSSKQPTRFRYRETSPTTFGLTPRDILLASDEQLNSFAGLKKMATFRDEARKKKDRKHLSKKARLRQWRMETFGDEDGPKGGFETLLGEEDGQEERRGKGAIEGAVEGAKKKKRRHKKRKTEAVEA
ncbi:Krr1-domain-containing protein [Mytilinidion resinicola]|uniref:Krr1-domain-containing protein n=1 Tax=Mytilinidion resinicola TaxID=574789 RepID=A0A6A6Y556_9PEZI|nr:Krr1-domain-containing protein [Mytilinidion resinicola]KAF2803154.1 Krr1-domain-containing protein [Mytilinidion resinicola]